jgi:phosphoribosylaminoimidazole-succinocarboxamide synthase
MPTVAVLKLHSSGKVREIYEWEDDLLLVASDRISTYDVVMPTLVPDKGKVLNRMSEFWFELTGDIVPNHFLSNDVPEEEMDRAMRVRRLEMYPVECVVRGYLSGSGWKEYKEGGAVCGIELPPNLLESDKLPEPIFTPATKAEIGDHDENVDFERAAEIVGDRALMEELRRISIEVYRRGADHAAERGIVLADTKFEFGRHAGAEIVLGLELDHAADPHVPDALEPERRQRPLARLALRVEDSLLRPDQHARLHLPPNLAVAPPDFAA